MYFKWANDGEVPDKAAWITTSVQGPVKAPGKKASTVVPSPSKLKSSSSPSWTEGPENERFALRMYGDGGSVLFKPARG
ncbi:MAG: hypothetical protein SV186_04370 [Candidatus Nanohaloarchaea archaeon]|nr:hypothetical protein [Candidatus Nanohaloarchaea archaeon]